MVFEENIICFEHMKHMKSNFREDAVNVSYSFHRGRGRTPSTVCGRSPSLEEGGLGGSPVKAYGLAVDWI